MNLKKAAATGLLITMALTCTAIAEENTEAAAAAEESTETAAAASMIIGTKEEGALKTEITNTTENDIVSIKIKTAEETEYTQELLSDGDIFTAGETRTLFFKPRQSEDETADSQLALQITMKDSTGTEVTAEIDPFPLADMSKGEIVIEDAVTFLNYKNLAGEEATTKKPKKIRDWGDGPVAEVVPSASNTITTYTYDSSGDYSYDNYSYDDYSYSDYSYSDYSYTEPAQTGGGDDDACVEDGLFY